MSEDGDILQRIQGLVDEEHQLRNDGQPDQDRLRHLEEQLDQCWDLLRQRRARREFDQDPGDAAVRPADTVEHYQQ
ncbi:MAG: DUF2630 family protein [Nocardioidaceae bacterium]|nr:DUF2630 family protein [Nocardioidaceae bacterium]NUS51158.1 DUF2630 family protein [Nocardioidaceae bacterium]